MKKTRWQNFRNNLLLGVLLVAPLWITVFVIRALFDFVTDGFVVFFPRVVRDSNFEVLARVVSLVLLVLILVLIGLFVRNYLGRRIYRSADRLLSSVPGISAIYRFVRQIIEVFFANRETSFKEVVLIEYPRKGVHSLGFVTASVPPQHISRLHAPDALKDEEWLSIFIPTTPNPTSGWFCIVPRREVVHVDMTPGEAMKLIISGGAVFPGEAEGTTDKSLLDRIEHIVDKPAEGTQPGA